MRKLIMWNLMTLDGMFEGSQPWDLSFHEWAWGPELERFSIEQLREVGALVFGRRTYEGMAAHWTAAKGEHDEIARFMNTMPKYVFSRTLERADWSNTTLVKGDATAAVTRLKQEAGNDLFVFGSARLSATLIQHGLYDEYRIGVVPGTLGAGNPLFKPEVPSRRMQLLESRALGDRCQLLRYQRAPDAGDVR